MANKTKSNSVWVLDYKHRFGNDINVYSSEDEARNAALGIVRYWRDEYEMDKKFSDEQCLNNWDSLTELAESIDYFEREIVSESKKKIEKVKDSRITIKNPLKGG